MNLRIIPRVVVDEETPVTAAVLNAGFRPRLEAVGAVEDADLAAGAIGAPALNARLISTQAEEVPGPNHWLWVEIGGVSRKVRVQDAAAVWPWHWFVESAFQAPGSATTAGGDQMLVRSGDEVRQVRLSAVTLEDLITAGTYRAGSLTVDRKGRVTAISAGDGTWTTGWVAVPPGLDRFRYTHGLGRVPALAQAWLRYIGAVGEEGEGEGGYGVNQEVSANAWFHRTGGPAFQWMVTENELIVWRVAADSDLRLVALGGTPMRPTPAKWQLKVNLRL